MSQAANVSRIEVKGGGILAVADAMVFIQKQALKILTEHGLGTIDVERWYPLQSVLAALQSVEAKIGLNTVKAVGRNIPGRVPFPPTLKTLEEALGAMNGAYRMSHRGMGSLGTYLYRSTGERSGQVTSDSPYPCPFDQGILEALSERFRPEDSLWTRVQHSPQSCRKSGARACAYDIIW